MNDICIVRDEVFLKHRLSEPHPENPTRLSTIYRHLEAKGFGGLPNLAAGPASEEALLRVHADEMVRKVMSVRGEEGWLDTDTYYNPASVDVALLAAGRTLSAAMEIWNGKYRRGFVLARPPGHHATRERAMGFCLFNHIAIAAQGILDAKPDARVAIVDFDLHHGNGSQFIFYDEPRVLFVSSHRFPFYPGTGTLDEVGVAEGKGTTVNFPLPARFGDEFFLSLYSRFALPMLRAFRPDMILVSAGFDGHTLDPMLGFSMTSQGYGNLAELLIQAAEETTGKILFVLEGGYHPEALADSVVKVLEKMQATPRASSQVNEGTDIRHHQRFLRAVTSSAESSLLAKFESHYKPYFPEL